MGACACSSRGGGMGEDDSSNAIDAPETAGVAGSGSAGGDRDPGTERAGGAVASAAATETVMPRGSSAIVTHNARVDKNVVGRVEAKDEAKAGTCAVASPADAGAENDAQVQHHWDESTSTPLKVPNGSLASPASPQDEESKSKRRLSGGLDGTAGSRAPVESMGAAAAAAAVSAASDSPTTEAHAVVPRHMKQDETATPPGYDAQRTPPSEGYDALSDLDSLSGGEMDENDVNGDAPAELRRYMKAFPRVRELLEEFRNFQLRGGNAGDAAGDEKGKWGSADDIQAGTSQRSGSGEPNGGPNSPTSPPPRLGAMQRQNRQDVSLSKSTDKMIKRIARKSLVLVRPTSIEDLFAKILGDPSKKATPPWGMRTKAVHLLANICCDDGTSPDAFKALFERVVGVILLQLTDRRSQVTKLVCTHMARVVERRSGQFLAFTGTILAPLLQLTKVTKKAIRQPAGSLAMRIATKVRDAPLVAGEQKTPVFEALRDATRDKARYVRREGFVIIAAMLRSQRVRRPLAGDHGRGRFARVLATIEAGFGDPDQKARSEAVRALVALAKVYPTEVASSGAVGRMAPLLRRKYDDTKRGIAPQSPAASPAPSPKGRRGGAKPWQRGNSRQSKSPRRGRGRGGSRKSKMRAWMAKQKKASAQRDAVLVLSANQAPPTAAEDAATGLTINLQLVSPSKGSTAAAERTGQQDEAAN